MRDTGHYAVRLYGVYAGLPDSVIEELWISLPGARFSRGDTKPIFGSRPGDAPKAVPKYLAVVYDTADFNPPHEELLDGWMRDQSPRAPGYRYQVWRVPETGL